MHFFRTEDTSGVRVITFDTPGRPVNVLGADVLRELADLVPDLPEDVPVLLCSGKNGFVAGADLNELRELTDADAVKELARLGQTVFASLRALPLTVAAVHGHCLGGGLELVLGCRRRVVSDHPKTQLGMPETKLALIPGWGGTQTLPRLVGRNRARDMILGGESVDAATAVAIGLADAVLPAEDFLAHAVAYARDHASSWEAREADESAVGVAEDLIEIATAEDDPADLALEREAFAALLLHPDAQERMEAFLNRRRDS